MSYIFHVCNLEPHEFKVFECVIFKDDSVVDDCFKDTVYLQGSIFWKKKFKAKFNNTSLASFSKKTCFKILKRA